MSISIFRVEHRRSGALNVLPPLMHRQIESSPSGYDEILADLNLVGIAQLIPVGLENLVVLGSIPIELLRDLG
jgi:hypothetical protein